MPNYKVYRSKNHPVNAIQFTGHNITDVQNFVQPKGSLSVETKAVYLYTDGNTAYPVDIGDWIAERLIDNSLYVIDDEDFNGSMSRKYKPKEPDI